MVSVHKNMVNIEHVLQYKSLMLWVRMPSAKFHVKNNDISRKDNVGRAVSRIKHTKATHESDECCNDPVRIQQIIHRRLEGNKEVIWIPHGSRSKYSRLREKNTSW